MQFSVVTLFPEWIQAYCTSSIIGRAQKAGVITIDTVNPRDFTYDVHHQVDDAPYGGGAGMVMMCKPITDSYESLLPLPEGARLLMTSPLGRPFSQAMAYELTHAPQVVLFCGHYEGFDARIMNLIPNLELVSLGDFVLTGGELAALSIIDATARLLPGALGKDASAQEESFADGLLEYPHYTRPPQFAGLDVPDILLSGNHAAIARWRRKKALHNTLLHRPDLLKSATLTPLDRVLLEEIGTETPLI